MSKKLITVIAAMFVTAASAQNLTANGFSYDNIDGYYNSGSITTNVDGNKVEADLAGFGVSVSKLLTENLFLTAGYGSVSGNSIKVGGISYPIDTDGTQTSFGLGYRFPIDSKIDFNIRVASISSKVEANATGVSISQTDRDTAIGAALRYKLNDGIELNANISSIDGEVNTGFGGAVNLSKTIALTGGYSTSDDATSTFIGLRVMY